MANFKKEVEMLINECGLENGSNTPDFILAQYLWECLQLFDKTVNRRIHYYGWDKGMEKK